MCFAVCYSVFTCFYSVFFIVKYGLASRRDAYTRRLVVKSHACPDFRCLCLPNAQTMLDNDSVVSHANFFNKTSGARDETSSSAASTRVLSRRVHARDATHVLPMEHLWTEFIAIIFGRRGYKKHPSVGGVCYCLSSFISTIELRRLLTDNEERRKE